MELDPKALEAAARAIAVKHGVDPDADGPGQRHAAEIDGVTTIIADHFGPLWRLFEVDAEAAIRAYRTFIKEGEAAPDNVARAIEYALSVESTAAKNGALRQALAALTASRSGETGWRGGLVVKPLEWKGDRYGFGGGLKYTITRQTFPQPSWSIVVRDHSGQHIVGHASEEEAAKAIAQADFDRRIHGSITEWRSDDLYDVLKTALEHASFALDGVVALDDEDEGKDGGSKTCQHAKRTVDRALKKLTSARETSQ